MTWLTWRSACCCSTAGRKSVPYAAAALCHACRHFPGELQKVLHWFRDYKIPDGKPANAFGYDNKCLDKAFTLNVRRLLLLAMSPLHAFGSSLPGAGDP